MNWDAKEVRKDAVIDGRWRYLLSRRWGPIFLEQRVLFVMLNPSTANEVQNDATIRRCLNYTERWGFNHLRVVNLYAYRSTSPKILLNLSVREAVGPRNNAYIVREARKVAQRGGYVIAAWGTKGNPDRVKEVMGLITSEVAVHCLGLTKDGHPAHP